MDKRTFVREVASGIGCDDRRAAGIVFVVLQELRNRLTAAEVRDVAAQLPTDLKRYWLAGDDPNRQVARTHRDEFLGRVRHWAALPDDIEAERSVIAVFAALQRLLGSTSGLEGEAWDVFSQLPKDLKLLWVEAGTHVAVTALAASTPSSSHARRA